MSKRNARRWFHDRFKRHRWVEVTHRHDLVIDGEECHYVIVECSCGLIKECVQVHHVLPSPVPGLIAGFVEVRITDLDRLEDAKVWADA